jgi:plasmid stabilization system protein ParE
MKIEIIELAQQELEDAVLFYEVAQSGLSRRFKEEVRQAIKRIRRYPKAWPIDRGEVRKCFVHKFPYNILYAIYHQKIVILAIAHQHRRPDYWIERLP